MKEQIGKVVEVYSTQAKVKLADSMQVIDAWNSVGAKIGNKVNLEERDVSTKKLRTITFGLPLLAFVAGFLFGGNLANYFDQNVWWGRGIGGVVWALISLFYIVPLRKNLSGKNNYWIVSRIID